MKHGHQYQQVQKHGLQYHLLQIHGQTITAGTETWTDTTPSNRHLVTTRIKDGKDEKFSEYSAQQSADNTDISNINIAEGCSPANLNNAVSTLNGIN
jgi:hypothetical protein